MVIGKELKNDMKGGVKKDEITSVKASSMQKNKVTDFHINREQKTFTMHFTCNFGRSASSGPLGFCAPCYLKNQEEKAEILGIRRLKCTDGKL